MTSHPSTDRSARSSDRAALLDALVQPVNVLVPVGVVVAGALTGVAWLTIVAIVCWLALVATTILVMPALAQKTAFVSSEEILTRLPEVKDARAKLAELQSTWMREIQTMEADIARQRAEIEANRLLWSPQERRDADGKLREDLYHRINVFPIAMPPLRDRGTDIELLAQHFLEVLNRQESAAKSFAPATIAALYAHSWPGNVRELKNYVQRAFILADDVIDANLAPAAVAAPESAPLLSVRVGTTLDEVSRRLIEATLAECGSKIRKGWIAPATASTGRAAA